MSRHRERSSFLREAGFGFVVSLIAAVAASTLALFLPAATVLRALVAAVGLVLVLRAIARSNEKTGRIVTLAVWLAAVAAIWLAGFGLPAFIATHVLLLWLVRALFTCSRPIEAGLELALTLLAASFATVAAVRTGSVFLASWTFVLVMALGAAIPALVRRWTEPKLETVPSDDPNRGFARASKAADEALQRIATRQGA
jgi:hypothetical protein